ncbi:hypothetical protein [Siccirubricoccus phaeus]|uniref:hypothetical protein n=1 Tax=Siccirubricoccus phaeus TaxID=2595053 RepID=UPI00165A4555|nr:hypothetical protein [Siccirubricoccus phaeus]
MANARENKGSDAQSVPVADAGARELRDLPGVHESGNLIRSAEQPHCEIALDPQGGA